MRKEMPSVEKQEWRYSTTYLDLTRHGNRFGGKMKVEVGGQTHEFDDEESLTPAGREASENFGANYPEEVKLVHPRGGETLRHGETGEDILKGSGKIGPSRTEAGVGAAPIIKGGKVIGSRIGVGLDYKASGISMDLIKSVKGIINNELNRLVVALTPKEQQEFIKQENKELRARLREQAQLVGLKEIMKDEESAKIAVENEAMELMHMLELSRRGVKAGDAVAIPNVGSGMFAESLFKYALVVEDLKTGEKKVGYDDVDEIGGFTKQATAFRIKAIRDLQAGIKNNDLENMEKDTKFEYEFTDPDRAEFFRGKRVYLDWDKVKELAKGAEARFNKKS